MIRLEAAASAGVGKLSDRNATAVVARCGDGQLLVLEQRRHDADLQGSVDYLSQHGARASVSTPRRISGHDHRTGRRLLANGSNGRQELLQECEATSRFELRPRQACGTFAAPTRGSGGAFAI